MPRKSEVCFARVLVRKLCALPIRGSGAKAFCFFFSKKKALLTSLPRQDYFANTATHSTWADHRNWSMGVAATSRYPDAASTAPSRARAPGLQLT